jgi:hypothetical protein
MTLLALLMVRIQVTLYHTDPSVLRGLDIESPGKLLSICAMGIRRH